MASKKISFFESSDEDEANIDVVVCSKKRLKFEKKEGKRLKFDESTFNGLDSSSSSVVSPQGQSTPSNSSNAALMNMYQQLKGTMDILLNQNSEIMKRLDSIEEVTNKSRKQAKTIYVPNNIKNDIKYAYKQLGRHDLNEWVVENGKSPFDESNEKSSNFIKKFVKSLNIETPDIDNVLSAGIKTYFESKRTALRKSRNKVPCTNDTARSQRKVHKAHRRKRILDSLNISTDDKDMVTKLIIPDMMSSEEEKEDDDGPYFSVKIPTWRGRKFTKILNRIDDAYKEKASKRAKLQMTDRKLGSPSKREFPKRHDALIKSHEAFFDLTNS